MVALSYIETMQLLLAEIGTKKGSLGSKMPSFYERKKYRTEFYKRFIEGWKQRDCIACNGSGYYDSDGSPPCGACDGTGKERYKPEPKRRKQNG
jgi:hypothetical protein